KTLHYSHAAKAIQIEREIWALAPERGGYVAKVAGLLRGELLKDRVVHTRRLELFLQDLARIIEERAARVEGAIADEIPQRSTAAELVEVESHAAGDRVPRDPIDRRGGIRNERLRVTKGKRFCEEWREPSAQGAAEQPLHLSDIGAAEHELQL